jgi:copper chaperone CopZ
MPFTFVHGSATKLVAPKAVTVKVDGLHSVDKRDALIKALLGVKGVTSVTIDQRKGVAIMYVAGPDREKVGIPHIHADVCDVRVGCEGWSNKPSYWRLSPPEYICSAV